MIPSTSWSTEIGYWLQFPKRCVILLPTSIAWKQLGVPEIIYRCVFVVGVVLPVSAAVYGCRGKCLSVHLHVAQFAAWAWKVRGVAAAALGANQAQDQREEAHTWRHTQRLKWRRHHFISITSSCTTTVTTIETIENYYYFDWYYFYYVYSACFNHRNLYSNFFRSKFSSWL